MIVRTNEMQDVVLDWAVGIAEGNFPDVHPRKKPYVEQYDGITGRFVRYAPSSDWRIAGRLIAHAKINIEYAPTTSTWNASILTQSGDSGDFAAHYQQSGLSPQEAAMRTWVCYRLGDSLDVPDALFA